MKKQRLTVIEVIKNDKSRFIVVVPYKKRKSIIDRLSNDMHFDSINIWEQSTLTK